MKLNRHIEYKGQNLETVATYLYHNPGARTRDVRNNLLRARGLDPKVVSSGFYSYIFNAGYGHAGKLWTRRDNGWHLTAQGLAHVR
jgi:hypothetical protein